MFTITGGTDDDFATELFNVGEGETPTDGQLSKVADLRQAIVAMHELYEAANNVAVTQQDRASDLRKMAEPQTVVERRR